MPYLLTTALPKCFGDVDDSLLLGEWCRLYGRGDTARKSDLMVPYHWDDREKLSKDFEILQSTNRVLLKELADKLNELHDVSYPERYWELLLGYWLNLFTSVLFDRWSCLNEAVARYHNLKTVIYPVATELCVPKDTSEAQRFFLEDWWNHMLFGQLIETFPEIERIVSRNEWPDEIHGNGLATPEKAEKVGIKRLIRNSLNGLLSVTSRWGRYTLVRSGLQPMQEAVINLRLGSVPHRLSLPEIKSLPLNPQLREWSLTGYEGKGSFEEIVRFFLPKMIPRIFLEGFEFYRKAVKGSRYAKSPKVIFTSNSHFSDDVFKIWAGQKREQGARLVIGQHGGGAFHKFNGATSYELSISDAYVSTGNGNCAIDDRIRDVGRFNNKFKIAKWDPNGLATLVTVAMPRYVVDVRSMPMAGQMLRYFEDQFLFYENLRKDIRDRIQIRVYPKGDYGWSQKQRWLDRFPSVLLDEGKVPLSIRASRSRLVIATYNATVYNELLSANIPTVIYWDPHYWEVSDAAQPWFDQLKSVGIFHETPESAAAHVKKVWQDIAGWWLSSRVQEVRVRYCRLYAYLPPNAQSRLAYVLKREGVGER